MEVQPPLDVIRLPMLCSASNEYLFLMPYYQRESKFLVEDSIQELLLNARLANHHHHHHQSLNREGRWGTTDDFATSFLHFPCSPLPSGTCRTPGLSIP